MSLLKRAMPLSRRRICRTRGGLCAFARFVLVDAAYIERGQTELQCDQRPRMVMQAPRNPQDVANQINPESGLVPTLVLRGHQPRRADCGRHREPLNRIERSEEHTSALQSLMRISYAVFCLKKKNPNKQRTRHSKTCQYYIR